MSKRGTTGRGWDFPTHLDYLVECVEDVKAAPLLAKAPALEELASAMLDMLRAMSDRIEALEAWRENANETR